MSMSSGGGPKAVSTMTGVQKKGFKELGQYLSQFIGASATETGVPAVSPEEDKAMADLKTWYEGLGGQFEELGLTSATKELLSGEAAYEYDTERSAKLFEEAVGKPSYEAFSKYVVPTISRAYKGFTTRRGKKIAEEGQNLQQDLNAKLAAWQQTEIEAGRSSKEAALNRIPSGFQMGTSLLTMPSQFALSYASAVGGVQQSKYEEAKAKTPEQSPWLPILLNYLGMQTQQVVNTPSKLTGFGTALAGIQGVSQTLATPLTGGTDTTAAKTLGSILLK